MFWKKKTDKNNIMLNGKLQLSILRAVLCLSYTNEQRETERESNIRNWKANGGGDGVRGWRVRLDCYEMKFWDLATTSFTSINGSKKTMQQSKRCLSTLWDGLWETHTLGGYVDIQQMGRGRERERERKRKDCLEKQQVMMIRLERRKPTGPPSEEGWWILLRF